MRLRVWPRQVKWARSGMCLKTSAVCSFLWSSLLSMVAVANVGPPSSGGQLVAEPMGVAEIAIVRETLVIDLRPLAEDGPVSVEAVYQLQNPKHEQTIDLFFASGAVGVRGFAVLFDGQPVASEPAPDAAIPESWQPPAETPGIHGRNLDYLSHRRQDVTPYAFELTIPSGGHELRVHYTADATRYHVGEPTVVRQFAYTLAPAASWQSFGGLDLTAQVPKGWLVAVTPDVHRDGDMFTASFENLPAASLAFTLQAAVPPAYWGVRWGSLGLFALGVVGGGPLCWRVGATLGRRHWLTSRDTRGGPIWPQSIGIGVLWALLVAGLGIMAIFAADLVLPSSQVSRYGYGQALAVFGLLLLMVPIVTIGFAVTQIAAVVTTHDPLGTAPRTP
jgi:hypothetical protein